MRKYDRNFDFVEKGRRYMKIVKEYLCDSNTPSDEEIRECIKIVETENCVVRLKWNFHYCGWYSLTVNKGMSFEECKNKLPKIYGM